MRLLTRMIMRDLLPVFLVALVFFVMVLQLLDIFTNLWRFLNNDVPMIQILHVSLLYFPKCVSYVLPVTLLFSVSFTLGNYFANNELIAILNCGVSLFRLSLPILILGLLISLGSFFFDQYVVIDSYRLKNQISQSLTGVKDNFNNSEVAILTGDGNMIYSANFYNDRGQLLSNPLIIERDDDGFIMRRIEADQAKWDTDKWKFIKVRIYTEYGNSTGPLLTQLVDFSDPLISEPPETFRQQNKDVEEMTLSDAKDWITSQIKAGLPYKKSLTDYYQRYSFALTSFIVTLISCALGSRFKKNILLMSLLTSLVLSVGYYIFQMLTSLLAKYGTISPILGAWLGFILFLVGGIILFRNSPT